MKINSTALDTIRDGALGTVKEAIGPALPESGAPGTFGYFVEWQDLGGVPVFIAGSRIRPAD